MKADIRKTMVLVEDTRKEMGRAIDPPTRRAVAIAVIANPFAGDYVEAMWLMLQHDEPEDFVVGTGVAHSVREFCELAFEQAGLRWEDHVRTDQRFLRPAELHHLVADPTKAERDLSWKPKVDFEGLVSMMLEADIRQVTAGR